MNQQDKERLRELAEKATPGPWHSVSLGQYWGEEEGEVHHADGQEVDGAEFVKPLGDVATTRGQAWLRDTDYIAAANPAAILDLLEENERLTAWIKSTKWPANAQEVRAFFRHNCESEQWAIDEHTASEDDRYQLTAHDFLSAADWWTDFLNRDIDAAMQHKGD